MYNNNSCRYQHLTKQGVENYIKLDLVTRALLLIAFSIAPLILLSSQISYAANQTSTMSLKASPNTSAGVAETANVLQNPKLPIGTGVKVGMSGIFERLKGDLNKFANDNEPSSDYRPNTTNHIQIPCQNPLLGPVCIR